MYEDRLKTKDLIKDMTPIQLQDLFTKYCASDAMLIARKKFGFYISSRVIKEAYADYILLLPEDEHGLV